MNLLLIRHGESISNSKNQLQGHYDSPLSKKGISQALELNNNFKQLNYTFTKVYSSDLQRAADTARIITQDLKVPEIVFTPLLRELDLGILERRFDHSLSDDERVKLSTIWVDFDSKIDGGESINQLLFRITSFLQTVLSEVTFDGKVLIVSHGGVIYNLLCRMWTFEINIDEWLKNCQINEIFLDREGGNVSLLTLNGEPLNPHQKIPLNSQLIA